MEIRIICKHCGGDLIQIASYEKRYERISFRCNRCEMTTTLTETGIYDRLKVFMK